MAFRTKGIQTLKDTATANSGAKISGKKDFTDNQIQMKTLQNENAANRRLRRNERYAGKADLARARQASKLARYEMLTKQSKYAAISSAAASTANNAINSANVWAKTAAGKNDGTQDGNKETPKNTGTNPYTGE